MSPLSRRTLLTAGLGTGAALGAGIGSLGPSAAYAGPPQPAIRPRADWAQGLAATGEMLTEAEGDVRFLIVHHSESPNTERAGSIPARLRGFFNFHTTTKQWPDVAYNFFVDPFGEIWEGRTGSLGGPVRGDATGGSQGFAELCCFVGDHTATPPTPGAMTAMTTLLAWLAGRYGIDLAAGKTIRFTSRGSNRWPRGTQVITDPIVGHRDMSRTACPGDALYPLVRSQLLVGAQRLTDAEGSTAPGPARSTPTAPAAATGSTAPRTTRSATSGGSAPTPASVPAEPGILDRVGDLAVPLGAATVVLGGAVIAGSVVLSQKDR